MVLVVIIFLAVFLSSFGFTIFFSSYEYFLSVLTNIFFSIYEYYALTCISKNYSLIYNKKQTKIIIIFIYLMGHNNLTKQ